MNNDEIERLDRYLNDLNANQVPSVEDDEIAHLLEVAQQLKGVEQQEAAVPDAQFSQALERRLVALQTERTGQRADGHRPGGWRSWPILSGKQRVTNRRVPQPAALGLAALLVLILVLVIPLLVATFSDRRLPALSSVAQAYAGIEGVPLPGTVSGDATFHLQADWPSAPARMTVYRQVAIPVTAAEAEAFAGRFGLAGPARRSGEHFIFEDQESRLTMSALAAGYYHFEKSALDPTGAQVDQAITASEALVLAEEFLRQHGLLHFDYTVDPSDEGGPDVHQIRFVRALAGRPVENTGIMVTLDAHTGQIMRIVSRMAPLEEVGDYPIQSPQEAFQALQDSRQVLLELKRREGPDVVVASQTFTFPDRESQIPYQPGDEVVLEGRLDVVASFDPVRYALRAGPPEDRWALTYQLVGPETAGMAPYDEFLLQVRGIIVTGEGGRPAVLVQSYQRMSPDEQIVTLRGTARLAPTASGGEQLILETDDGTIYALTPMGRDPGEVTFWQEQGLNELQRSTYVKGVLSEERSPEGYLAIEVGDMVIGGETGTQATLGAKNQDNRLLAGDLVIEQVELLYHAFPVSPGGAITSQAPDLVFVQPVYAFTGHMADGQTNFRAYIQAIP
ncbi:MAG: hypothetical protein RRC07_10940 [Anaerolineae bacterium]|nr:hypothetical protein [Anaerolineae bacterium]